jgi:hypothetical protein
MLILSGGEKGGAGKTTNAKLTLDFLRMRGVRVAAYDMDISNPILYRTYATKDENGKRIHDQDPFRGVRTIDYSDDQAFQDFLSGLQPENNYLIDLPGGEAVTLDKIDEKYFFLDTLAVMQIPLMILFALDGTVMDSASILLKHIKRYGDTTKIAVFLSRHFSPGGKFPHYADSVCPQLLKEKGGIEIEIPEFPSILVAKLDRASLSFGYATSTACPLFTVPERIRMFGFLNRAYQGLESILQFFPEAKSLKASNE